METIISNICLHDKKRNHGLREQYIDKALANWLYQCIVKNKVASPDEILSKHKQLEDETPKE